MKIGRSVFAAYIAILIFTTQFLSAGAAIQENDGGSHPAAVEFDTPLTLEIEPDIPDDAPYAPGEIIVKMKDDVGLARTNMARSANEISDDTYVMEVPVGQEETIITELLKNDSVLYAEPNYIYEPEPASPEAFIPGQQWHLDKISARSVWTTYNGSGVKVAVIDTGMDMTHPDLIPAVHSSYKVTGGDVTSPLTEDQQTHGTHVAGIIGARGNSSGVAPGSSLIPYGASFIDPVDSKVKFTAQDIATSIRHAADNGAKIINMSFGGYAYSVTYWNAINYALEKDVIFFASAGNDARIDPHYPSDYPGVICVGSTDRYDNKVPSSNYGDRVEIVAPGASIYSTVPIGDWTLKSGTSMASPVAAGVGALIAQKYPNINQQQMTYILTQSAVDVGSAGYDVDTGYGRVDAQAAIQMPLQAWDDGGMDDFTWCAKTISVGDTKTGKLNFIDDIDYYEVTLASAQTVIVELTAPSDHAILKPWIHQTGQSDIIASFQSKKHAGIAAENVVQAGDVHRELRTLAAGTHYIGITSNTHGICSYNPYTLRILPVSADLANLTLSPGTLSPVFDSETTDYTATVSNATDKITVTPTASGNATITVNTTAVTSGTASSDITLNVGQNTITIVVTAEDGTTTKTYTVTVTREAPASSSDADLASLGLSVGTLSPAFASATINYTTTVPNATDKIKVTPTASGNAAIEVNGIAVTSGSASGDITLNPGQNTITIVVTAEDGVTTKTYTIVVTREAAPLSNNADLASLTLSAGTLSPAFASATINYTTTVPNATDKITVTPTASGNATIEVNGIAVNSGSASNDITLNVGSNNTITVVVTAEDNVTQKTYTITVTREAPAPSNDADLSSLTLSAGALSPAFDPAILGYTATVPDATDKISITLSALTNATITLNGTTMTSSSASGDIPLVVGTNTITIDVVATDGTTKTYTIVVTRGAGISAKHNIVINTSGNGVAYASLQTAGLGDTVSVQATPASGNQFVRWVVNYGAVSLANSPSTYFTMPDSEVVLTAVFQPTTSTTYPYTPPTAPSPQSPATTSPSETITSATNERTGQSSGQRATTPYSFVIWTDTGSSNVSSPPPAPSQSTAASFQFSQNGESVPYMMTPYPKYLSIKPIASNAVTDSTLLIKAHSAQLPIRFELGQISAELQTKAFASQDVQLQIAEQIDEEQQKPFMRYKEADRLTAIWKVTSSATQQPTLRLALSKLYYPNQIKICRYDEVTGHMYSVPSDKWSIARTGEQVFVRIEEAKNGAYCVVKN